MDHGNFTTVCKEDIRNNVRIGVNILIFQYDWGIDQLISQSPAILLLGL